MAAGASSAQKTTVRAISSARVTLPSGCWARISPPLGPARNSAAISVSTQPGATQ